MSSPPLSRKANSALVRLRYAKSLELNEGLEELLEGNEGLESAAEIVERKIEAGQYILTQYLARLIVGVRSETLFQKVRQQLLGDNAALLILYRGRCPDAQIEEKLAETLYRLREDDGNPQRREIAEVMEEVGSDAVLPVLQAIIFDLGETLHAKQVFGEALEGISDGSEDFRKKVQRKLPGLEAASRAKFLQAVAAAISAIKARSAAQAI